ncbi:MAG: hypothetical protein HFG22_17940 [Lachnospiraceae bacterium]|nr:hypothetical protein [Lachnospiraceae bacterium]
MEEQYGPDRTILTLPFFEKTSRKSKWKKQAEKINGYSGTKKTEGRWSMGLGGMSDDLFCTLPFPDRGHHPGL